MTIEDKMQQQKLKEFDCTLRESTGQLVWFLYWMFAAVVLMVGLVLIFDGMFDPDAWLLLGYVWRSCRLYLFLFSCCKESDNC